jgi:hypothetical protein
MLIFPLALPSQVHPCYPRRHSLRRARQRRIRNLRNLRSLRPQDLPQRP